MRTYINQIKCKIENQIRNQIKNRKNCVLYKKIAVYSIITLLLLWQTTGGHMRLAWWTTVYPQSLYETGIVEETDADTMAEEDENSTQAEKDESSAQAEKDESSAQAEKSGNSVTADTAKADKKETGKKTDSEEKKQEESIQIKWKLAEWIGHLFSKGQL